MEGSDDPAAELDEQETILPKLAVGEQIYAPDNLDARLIVAALDEKGHQTSPPPRFTEASLVKRLEEEGIGRPSTYAATVGTIQRRGYVTRQGKALVPSFTAFAVTRLLRDHFGEYVEVGFTAEMEEILDDISNGNRDWLDFIRAFFRGDGKHPGLENLVNQKAEVIDYPFIDLGNDPEQGLPVQIRIGRFGPYVSWGEHKASIPADVAPADLMIERALQIVQAKAEGPRSLGEDPETGEKVYVMLGRFGPYVQLGETPTDKKADKPRRASLGRNHSEDTLTLDDALKLLSLPRELGSADDGEPIIANVGRFGPYVKKGDDFRSLAPEDDVYVVTLERAKELLAQEKKSMRRQRAAPKELRALGAHPVSGAAVRILDGRYGPYVTDGETNASLPRGTAPEALTMEEAKALLAARASAPKAGRRGRAAKKAAPAAVAKKAPRKAKRAPVGV